MTTEPLRVRSVTIPVAELHWRFSRSSGPGGQSVNTSDTRAELSFDVAGSAALPEVLRQRALSRLAPRLAGGVLTVAASEHRSQLRNRDAAWARMTALLDDALAPPPRRRRATRPTRHSVERRIAGKRRRGEVKRLRQPPND